MKKTIMAMIAVACLVVISLSSFALSYMQAPGSEGPKNRITDTDTQFADSISLQAFNEEIQQASMSDIARNPDKVAGSCKGQEEQTLSKHEFILWPTETNQNPISALPSPLPDGRIFLRSSAGGEDPIPYIPTWNPKTASSPPVEPLELDI